MRKRRMNVLNRAKSYYDQMSQEDSVKPGDFSRVGTIPKINRMLNEPFKDMSRGINKFSKKLFRDF